MRISRRRLLSGTAAVSMPIVIAAPAVRAGTPPFLWGKTSRRLPTTQTISFGALTMVGHGGHPLGYTGGRTLAISAGNTSGHWQIDDQNCLVPRNGAGAYGTIGPTFLTGNAAYVLTVIEQDSLGNPTGQSTAVTINMVANAAYVREKTTGANADTTSSNQLQRRLTFTGTGTLPADVTVYIYCRDGVFNPSSALGFGFNAPSTIPWLQGPGVVVLSENPDTSLDDNLNFRRGGGAVFGRLRCNVSQDGGPFPLEFRDITFRYSDPNFTVPAELLRWVNGGAMVSRRCRFECADAIPESSVLLVNGSYSPGQSLTEQGPSVIDCYFRRLAVAVTQSGYRPVATGNVFEKITVDHFRHKDAQGELVTDNFMFDMMSDLKLELNPANATYGAPVAGWHPDGCQTVMNGINGRLTDVGPVEGGEYARNIIIRSSVLRPITDINGAIIDVDEQLDLHGMLFDDIFNSSRWVAAQIHHNIMLICDNSAVQLNGHTNPNVHHNTLLYLPSIDGVNVINTLNGGQPQIIFNINTSKGNPAWGSGGTINRNVTNEIRVFANWANPPSTSPNTVKPRADADYTTWFLSILPNFPRNGGGTLPVLPAKNRASVIAACVPAAVSSPLQKTDGIGVWFHGALNPDVSWPGDGYYTPGALPMAT